MRGNPPTPSSTSASAITEAKDTVQKWKRSIESFASPSPSPLTRIRPSSPLGLSSIQHDTSAIEGFAYSQLVDALRQEVARLENDKSSLIEEFTYKERDLRARVHHVVKETREATLLEVQQTFVQYEAEIRKKEDELVKLADASTTDKEVLRAKLKSNMKTLDETFSTLDTIVEEAKNENTEKSKLQDKVSSLAAQLRAETERHEGYKSEWLEKEREMSRSILTLKDTVNSLELQLMQTHTELGSAKSSAETLKTEELRLRKQLSEYQDTLAASRIESQSTQHALADEVDKCKNEASQVENELRAHISKTENLVSEKEEKILQLEQSLGRSKKELEEERQLSSHRLSSLEASLAMAQQEALEGSSQAEESNRRLAVVEAKLSSLRKDASDAAVEASSIMSQREGALERERAKSAALADANDEVKTLLEEQKDKVVLLEATLASVKQEIDHERAERAKLHMDSETAAREADRKIAEAESTTNLLRIEKEHLKEREQTLTDEINKMKEEAMVQMRSSSSAKMAADSGLYEEKERRQRAEQQAADLERQLGNVKEQLEEERLKCEELKMDRDSARKGISEALDQSRGRELDLTRKVEELQTDKNRSLEEERSKLFRLENELASLKAGTEFKQKELERQVELLCARKESLENEVKSLQKSYDETVAELEDALRSEREGREKTTKQFQATRAALEKESSGNLEAVRKAETHIAMVEDELSETCRNLKTLQVENMELQAASAHHSATYASTIRSLEARLAAEESASRNLSTALQELENERKERLESQSKMEEKHEQMADWTKGALEASRERTSELEKLTEDLDQKAKRWESSCHESQAHVERLLQDNADLLRQLEALQKSAPKAPVSFHDSSYSPGNEELHQATNFLQTQNSSGSGGIGNQDLEERLDKAKAELHAKNEELAALREACEQLGHASDQKQEFQKEVEQKVRILEEEIAHCEKMEEENERLKGRLSATTDTLEALQEKLESGESGKVQQLQLTIHEYERKIEETETAMENMEFSNNTVIAGLERKVELLEAELSQLKSAQDEGSNGGEGEGEINAPRVSVISASEDGDELRRALKEVDQLEDQVAETRDNNDKLERENSELLQQVDEMRVQVTEMENEVAKYKEAQEEDSYLKEQAEEDAKYLMESKEHLETELRNATEKFAEWKAEWTSKYQQLEKEAAELSEQKEQLEEEVRELAAQVESLGLESVGARADLEGTISRLEQELGDAKAREAASAEKVKHLEEDLQRKKASLKGVEDECDTLALQKEEMSAKLAGLEAELDFFRSQTETAAASEAGVAELEKLRERCGKLEEENSELRSSAFTLEKKVEQLRHDAENHVGQGEMQQKYQELVFSRRKELQDHEVATARLTHKLEAALSKVRELEEGESGGRNSKEAKIVQRVEAEGVKNRALTQQLNDANDRLTRLSEEVNELKEDKEDLEKELEALKASKGATGDLKDVQNRLKEAEKDRRSLREERDEMESQKLRFEIQVEKLEKENAELRVHSGVESGDEISAEKRKSALLTEELEDVRLRLSESNAALEAERRSMNAVKIELENTKERSQMMKAASDRREKREAGAAKEMEMLKKRLESQELEIQDLENQVLELTNELDDAKTELEEVKEGL